MTRIPRTGFTLIELLVALIVSLTIGGIITTVLTHQQRLVAQVNTTLSLREHLRDAADILTADLRSTPSTPTAFPFASDTAIEFFSMIGASTLCQSPIGNQLSLPPDTLANGNTLTSWITVPDSNDLVEIYHDSGTFSPTRGWLSFRIASLTSTQLSTTCPPESGFTNPLDAARGARAYTLTLQTPPPLSITKGAPLRFLRRARYSFYRASDNHWYLGYRRCHPTSGLCDIIQPISGPYTKSSAPPLRFRYHTPTGPIAAPNSPIANLTRVDLLLTLPKPTLNTPSLPDSILTTLTFRNQL
jgi:type II secretory pathway pseudopilin PulG